MQKNGVLPGAMSTINFSPRLRGSMNRPVRCEIFDARASFSLRVDLDIISADAPRRWSLVGSSRSWGGFRPRILAMSDQGDRVWRKVEWVEELRLRAKTFSGSVRHVTDKTHLNGRCARRGSHVHIRCPSASSRSKPRSMAAHRPLIWPTFYTYERLSGLGWGLGAPFAAAAFLPPIYWPLFSDCHT